MAARAHVLRRLGRRAVPIDRVRFRGLRRGAPVSRVFGLDRGVPVDRYYIEQFLTRHAADVRGRVLEVGGDAYTRRFGGDRVSAIDVLHLNAGNDQATIVADLAAGDAIPSSTFDCVVLTQTLQFVYNLPAAVATLHRILKTRGVVLATVPGISQISRYDAERWGDYWRFTTQSARMLFEEVFPSASVDVTAYGSVLSATAFLHGLAVEDLSRREREMRDEDYQLIVAVRAVKP